ncbi:hypothetical protein Q5752_005788 [Cryptotrichosporon argae]
MADEQDDFGAEPAASLVDLLHATARDRNLAQPDLASPHAASYLDTLLSLPLDSLLIEATVIASQSATVESDLINLCYREYPTFIAVHKCSSAITSAFDDFSGSLTHLLDAVPALEDECRQFTEATAAVQDERAQAMLVQDHQDKLFDLLEIPQLMDTCVRNGYYQEALELSTHASSLATPYPWNPLVLDVAKEVDGVLQLMLAQLLVLLREPVKFPSLIKAVNFLRRLRKIDEDDLALAFLIGRAHNYTTHLVAIERDRADVVRYIRKYIDVFREHVFDIISQYGTIFLDGNDSALLTLHLADFGEHCVKTLVQFVAYNVPRLGADSASLSSILVQLGYCATSFARVGLDFTALITESFRAAVSSAFAQSVASAASKLCGALGDAAKGSATPSQTLFAADYVSRLVGGNVAPSIPTGSFDNPPSELANLPLLAIFVNSQLSALNALRLLAPHNLRPILDSTLTSSLLACTAAISQYVCAKASNAPMQAGHRRTPSSPRADLVRRNSESQLTPEARNAKHKEARRACWTFADAWVSIVCPLLLSALDTGVYEKPTTTPVDLATALEEMRLFLAAHKDSTSVNGVNTHRPVTPPTAIGTISPPAAIPEEGEDDNASAVDMSEFGHAPTRLASVADSGKDDGSNALGLLPSLLIDGLPVDDPAPRELVPEDRRASFATEATPSVAISSQNGDSHPAASLLVEDLFAPLAERASGEPKSAQAMSPPNSIAVPLPAALSDIPSATAARLAAELEAQADRVPGPTVSAEEPTEHASSAPMSAQDVAMDDGLSQFVSPAVSPEQRLAAVGPAAEGPAAEDPAANGPAADGPAAETEQNLEQSATPALVATTSSTTAARTVADVASDGVLAPTLSGIASTSEPRADVADEPASSRVNGADTQSSTVYKPGLGEATAQVDAKSTSHNPFEGARGISAPGDTSPGLGSTVATSTVASPTASAEPSRAPSPDVTLLPSANVNSSTDHSGHTPAVQGGSGAGSGPGGGAKKKKKKKGKK